MSEIATHNQPKLKVGDLVQQGARVIKFKGGKAPEKSKRIGIVLEVAELDAGICESPNGDWFSFIGRSVTVLWDNGKVSENFAENSLEIISAS